MDTVILPWLAPRMVTSEQHQAAALMLRQNEAHFASAAPRLIEQWLGTLGTLCAKNMSPGDASAKLRAYGEGLRDYPAHCFTRDTVYAAARQFNWFPSFGEVSAYLDAIYDPARRLRQRLLGVLGAKIGNPVEPDPKRPKYQELTAEQRAEFDKTMADFRRTNGSGSRPVTPTKRIKPIHVRQSWRDDEPTSENVSRGTIE